jgi:hypothetical protein
MALWLKSDKEIKALQRVLEVFLRYMLFTHLM